MLGCLTHTHAVDIGASLAVLPLNDNQADASTIEGAAFVLEADLQGATFEAAEPAWHPSGTSFPPFGGSLWWSWIAPDSGLWTWDALESPNSVFVSINTTPITEGARPFASSFLRPGPLLEPHVNALGSFDKSGVFQAKRGERYLIRLTSLLSDGAWTNLWRHFEELRFGIPLPPISSYPTTVRFAPVSGPKPPNDDFGGRSSFPTLPATVDADLSHAASEAEEPLVNTAALGQTRWWSYRAVQYGSLRLSFGTNYSPPVVSIYEVNGDRPGSLVTHSATRRGTDLAQCPSCSYSFDAGRSALEFDTRPDTEYAIQLDRFPSSDERATLQVEFVPSPANDLPEHATPLLGDDLELWVNNRGSTWLAGEPRLPGLSGSNSIWYSWRAPSAGIVQLGSQPGIRHLDPGWSGGGVIITGVPVWWSSVLLSWADLFPLPGFVPVFGFFHSPLPSTAPGNDPAPLATGTTNTVLELSFSTNLLINLDGRANTSGETWLFLLHTPTPSNDHWSNRVRLPSEAGVAEGRTFAATPEPGDNVLLGVTNTLLRTVWWEWKAPSSGRWALPVLRDDGWNGLVIFRGAEPLASNQVAPGPEGVLCFEAQAGEIFQIAAYDRLSNSFGSSFIFAIRPVKLPELRLVFPTSTEWGDHMLELQVEANPGLPCIIEVSSNLIDWHPHWYFSQPHGFTLQARVDSEQLFYRTRWDGTPAP